VKLAPNIYEDIVVTLFSGLLPTVTLTFDPQNTTKPKTFVTKIEWNCLYWFAKYGVVRPTWPWPL